MTTDSASHGANGRRRAAHPERNGATARAHDETPADMPTFDETFSQLEATVAALESGELDLNEAVEVFEQGMRLAQLCQGILDRAELRVNQLVASDTEANGLTIEPLDFEDD